MGFYEAWSEHDYNPFIVFDGDGKVKSLNQEAQYLLGVVQNKDIFEITQTYASKTYGFKTTAIDISFGSYQFYAITVGYIDEKEIGIKLYKKSANKFMSIEEGESVNLYILLDLCISATSTRSQAHFTKKFDPTFPDIKLQIDDFTKLLDKVYQSNISATFIKTQLSLITGEYIRQDGKKYPIFAITITSDAKDSSYEKDIELIASKSNTLVQFYENKTVIKSAMMIESVNITV